VLGNAPVNDPQLDSRPALQRQSTTNLNTEIQLDIASEHNLYNGFSANLSDGGLFVATYETHAVGDRLNVRFRLPDVEDVILAKVEVKWVRGVEAGEEGVAGFGAAFVELPEHARGAVARFTQVREPLFYTE
jgi:uncharacterized protein (TIGR02266 family)